MEIKRKRSERPDVISAEETLNVTSAYGKDGKESARQERMNVRKFLVEPAYVRVNAGMTKNMGNYESLRIDVSLTVPCYTEEVDRVFPRVAERVSVFLQEELKNYE